MKRLPRTYVYLLLSHEQRGTVYIGMTNNLRRRFRQHNSDNNKGYTRGRRWHLLAVRMFLDRHSAALVESQLKRYYHGRGNRQLDAWMRRSVSRLQVLSDRHGIHHKALASGGRKKR